MSTGGRLELLSRLRSETAAIVAKARGGNIAPNELARAVEDRQKLVEQLSDFDGPVTPAEKRLLNEVANLDRTLSRWCETKQRDIAHHLVRRPNRAPAPQTRARIVSQDA